MHPCVRKYWSFLGELSIEDGIVIKGQQIIIPSELQELYLKKIHDGHQGVVRCQQRARSCIYWPGINADIESLVSSCALCQKYQASQQRETLEPVMDIPHISWHTLGTDIFTQDRKNYLIIADYHSKFPLVEPLGNSATIK